jgi:hypothetical protein
MIELTQDWPNDADGDVFRRLLTNGFDFSANYAVDYNIDFESWPASAAAVTLLESMYGKVTLYPLGEDLGGYAEFQVVGPVTYEGVTSVQRNASAAMQRFGGVCDSWGVMQPAP